MQEIPQSIPISAGPEHGDIDLLKESCAHRQSRAKEAVARIISQHSQKNTCLDLANQSIKIIPHDIFVFSKLQQLYLEGNQISELQREFFHHLPSLTWLDLRNNCLKSLPSNIGDHKCLKQLLLEGNELVGLPVELGQVKTLTALSLHGNPLNFPPNEIIRQGVKVVKAFLWEEYCKKVGLEVDDGSIARTLSNIIDEVDEYNQEKQQKPAVSKQHLPFNNFTLSKPFPIYPREVDRYRRMSHNSAQLIQQFKDRMESFQDKAKNMESVLKTKSKRRQSANARLSSDIDSDDTNSTLNFSAQRETFTVEKTRATDTTITTTDIPSNNDQDMETDTSQHQRDDDVTMEKQEETFEEKETKQTPMRSAKEDDIKERMRLHSRKLKRRNNQEKSVNEKEEAAMPPEFVEVNEQYRFRAFTGDLIPETPPTTNHHSTL